jgi:hypothetical protein
MDMKPLINADGISYSADELNALFDAVEAEHKAGARETLTRVVQRTGLDRSKLAQFYTIRNMAAELKRMAK